MRGVWGWMAAGLLAWAPMTAAGEPADYGVASLAGLAAVRLVLDAGEGVDSADAEVALLSRLRQAGIAVAPAAPAVLHAAARAGGAGAGAELLLVQAVCLERDPAVSGEVATWARGASLRAVGGGEGGGQAVDALGTLADEFVGDWRRANAAP